MDIVFTVSDLTLNLEHFERQIVQPAMERLWEQWREEVWLLGLSCRAHSALLWSGATTMADARKLGQAHFRAINNVGRVTLAEIEAALEGWDGAAQ